MSQPIVFLSRPSMIDAVNEIPSAALLVYHVVDDYAAYAGSNSYRTAQLEKKMWSLVDAGIVTSKKLYEAKRHFKGHTYLVPNGVNYRAYAGALADPYLPEDLRDIQGPRLGYIGLIGDRLNLNMIKQLAQDHPEWSLVFLGEVKLVQQVEIWRALQAMPNVHYLGQVDVSKVPYYVKGFQVGLMPYTQNQESEHMNPLKLFDYLAAGLPIAAIDIPAAREFTQYIHLADSPGNFAQAVRAALTDMAPERCMARRRIAAQHTWEARAEQISNLLEAQLALKSSNRETIEQQQGDEF